MCATKELLSFGRDDFGDHRYGPIFWTEKTLPPGRAVNFVVQTADVRTIAGITNVDLNSTDLCEIPDDEEFKGDINDPDRGLWQMVDLSELFGNMEIGSVIRFRYKAAVETKKKKYPAELNIRHEKGNSKIFPPEWKKIQMKTLEPVYLVIRTPSDTLELQMISSDELMKHASDMEAVLKKRVNPTLEDAMESAKLSGRKDTLKAGDDDSFFREDVSCQICYKRKIDTVLWACGHAYMCSDCAETQRLSVGRCPFCTITFDRFKIIKAPWLGDL